MKNKVTEDRSATQYSVILKFPSHGLLKFANLSFYSPLKNQGWPWLVILDLSVNKKVKKKGAVLPLPCFPFLFVFNI